MATRQLREHFYDRNNVTFHPFVDRPLRFFEQGNALNKRKDQCPLHCTQEYSEQRHGRQHHAPTGTY
jgi:hypothetical protein